MPLTITDPATTISLTTLDAAKADLALAGSTDDAFIQVLIEQASAAIVSWCGRPFAAEGVRETFYLDRPERPLVLSRWPIVEVTAVTVAGSAESPANVGGEDAGLLYRLDGSGRSIPWPPGSIVVDYRVGYILPGDPNRTLPPDIERAALSLVKAWFHARGRDPSVKRDDVVGVGETEFFNAARSDLAPEAEALLAPYRGRVFA